MKGLPGVMSRARAYLVEDGALSFSIITRYEILRGLKAKKAVVQSAAFDRLCEVSNAAQVKKKRRQRPGAPETKPEGRQGVPVRSGRRHHSATIRLVMETRVMLVRKLG